MQPVYKFIAGQWVPVGELSVSVEGGKFTYDKAYRTSGTGPLDNDQLRLLTKRDVIVPKESRFGIPGIIHDSGPDAWGTAVIKHSLGRAPTPLESLVLSHSDGAGDLTVGDPGAKEQSYDYSLPEVFDMVQARMDGIDYGTDRNLDQELSPETALGGAKPKASIIKDGRQWIAKLPERGDVITLACFEDFAMKLGRHFGIETAESECHEMPNGKWIYLTARFDRVHEESGLRRIPFSSAMTVMGQKVPGQHYSYIDFAARLDVRKWIDPERLQETKVELWKRIVFNAMIGNMDDHARNHALIKFGDYWQLSPAYDLVPTRHHIENLTSAMYVSRTSDGGSAFLSMKNLMLSANQLGIETEQAMQMILSGTANVMNAWDALAKEYPETVQNALSHARLLTENLHLQARGYEDVEMFTKKKRNTWRWKPA